ncbi:MAG TPA: phosphoglucosamine mutase [Microthrixaceae bacterium]|nr:phosphoglucosamine mutase [Microthrixaceae bacterium]
MHIRFGTDGVRGLANQALTVELALAIGRAAVRVFPSASVVIGRDTRRSGDMLELAVAAGVCAEGSDAVLMGVTPTPAVAAASAREMVTGVVISASHNAFADNGIKLFAPGGRKLSDEEQSAVEAIIAKLLQPGIHSGPVGAAVGIVRHDAVVAPPADDELADDELAASVPHKNRSELYLDDVAAALGDVSLAGLRVVVDCANGANSQLAPRLLRRLDARVDVIGDEPDGLNINAGFGSTDIGALSARVVETGADLGIAFDGDADRLIAVDHTGAAVDGDHIIALCALDLAARRKLRSNTVVVTVMSNLGFFKAMEKAGIEVVSTPVGDRNVLEALAAGGYSLGGEQSGHIIFSDVSTTGDGLLAAAMLLDLVKRSGRTLAECSAAAMTRLPQVLLNVPVAADAAGAVERLAAQIAEAEGELGSEGRILVRASGTEPLVRVMVEATDGTVAKSVATRLAENLGRI